MWNLRCMFVFACVYLTGLTVTIFQTIYSLYKYFYFKKQKVSDVKYEKVAVVTGGTSGIGQAILKKLSALNYVVVAPVLHKPCDPIVGVQYLCMDLKEISSVLKTSSLIIQDYPKIHLLVNCAGVMFVPLRYTTFHTEEHFAVNYLSHFLLTLLCIPSLNSVSNSKIINMTSSLYWLGQSDITNDIIWPLPSNYSPYLSYASSKLYMIMFSYKIARYFFKSNISVVAYDPGTVYTSLYQHSGRLPNTFVQLFGKYFLRSPDSAANDVAQLAESDLAPVSFYLGWCQSFASSKSVFNNITLQDKLWETSIKLSGIDLSG